jgi:hypothetical protein
MPGRAFLTRAEYCRPPDSFVDFSDEIDRQR